MGGRFPNQWNHNPNNFYNIKRSKYEVNSGIEVYYFVCFIVARKLQMFYDRGDTKYRKPQEKN